MSQPLATPGPGRVETLALVRSVILSAMAESTVEAAYAAALAAAEVMPVRDVPAVIAVFAVQSCGGVFVTTEEMAAQAARVAELQREIEEIRKRMEGDQ